MLGPQPYRVYISDKFIVVAIDLAGVSPENVELSFPSCKKNTKSQNTKLTQILATESTPMHARNDPENNECTSQILPQIRYHKITQKF